MISLRSCQSPPLFFSPDGPGGGASHLSSSFLLLCSLLQRIAFGSPLARSQVFPSPLLSLFVDLIRLSLLSDVHKNIPSSLFGRSTRRRDCTPTPTASPTAGGAARSPSALKLIRSCDSGAKRANVKTCLLRFYFGYCSSSRLPFPSSSLSRAPLPPSLLPILPSLLSARFPAPKSHHKSALHNSTSRRKRSKGSRIHNIHVDRYCAGYPNTGHGLNKLRLPSRRRSTFVGSSPVCPKWFEFH